MKDFLKNLIILLGDCEPLLKIESAFSYKFVLLNETQSELRKLNDPKLALSYSYARSSLQISTLASYQKCKDAFKNDQVFKYASKFAGYWGTFESVFQNIIYNCGQIRNNRVIFNQDCVMKEVNKLRDQFSSNKVHITCTARLLGVNSTCKEISINNELGLHRLNRRERNNRQLNIFQFSSGYQESEIAFHPIELRMSINVEVDRSQNGAFFHATNKAHEIGRETFYKVLDAILFVESGEIQLSPIRFEGGPIGGTVIVGVHPNIIPNLSVKIKRHETTNILEVYKLICDKSPRSDKIFSQSLRRFILGRKRKNLHDKLVDYVISWESILLTQKNSPIKDELAYRFSINGSSLLAQFLRKKDKKIYFKKMKCAYNLRSQIVHGGGEKDLNKILRNGEVTDLNEVCRFLETNFKKAIWWLFEIEPKNRPYTKEEGWEELLWP